MERKMSINMSWEEIERLIEGQKQSWLALLESLKCIRDRFILARAGVDSAEEHADEAWYIDVQEVIEDALNQCDNMEADILQGVENCEMITKIGRPDYSPPLIEGLVDKFKATYVEKSTIDINPDNPEECEFFSSLLEHLNKLEEERRKSGPLDGKFLIFYMLESNRHMFERYYSDVENINLVLSPFEELLRSKIHKVKFIQ